MQRACKRPHVGCVCAIVLIVASFHPSDALAADAKQFRDDLNHLCAAPSRAVGSDGYYAAARYIEQQLASLPNVELKVQQFPILVPVTRSATLRRDSGAAAEPVYPFWPAHIRLNATPPSGITGNCVYIRDATFDQITPSQLKGQIAVCSATADDRWVNAFYFGAKALVLLGDDDTTNVNLRSHEVFAPVDLPRFYIPPGKLNDDLRAGRVAGNVTITASANSQRKTATNVYALIKSPGAVGPALFITVPYDASCLVPDLAIGASQATQSACGLALARHYSKNPPNRPLVIAFTGGDAIAQLATRNLLMTFAEVPAHWQGELNDLTEKRLRAAQDVARLGASAADPTQLNLRTDRTTIDRIATIIETDAALEQDELFRLRQQSPSDPRIKQVEDHQANLTRLRYTFLEHPADLRNELEKPARDYIQRTVGQLNATNGLIRQHDDRIAQLQSRIALYEWLASKTNRNPNPSSRNNDSRLIELLIALDLSDHNTRCGPMFVGKYLSRSNLAQIQDYRDYFARTERAFDEGNPAAKWWGSVRDTIDLAPFNGAHSPSTWRCAPLAIGSEMCFAWGVPGFSMITLDDLRLRRDTPTDTLEHLNTDNILPQLNAVEQTLAHAWSDPSFRGPPDLPWQRMDLTGQVVSPAPGKPVPDLPRAGFLVTYHVTDDNVAHIPKPTALPWVLGTRRTEVVDTDAEGNWRIEGLPRNIDQQFIALEAFRCDSNSGAINATSDLAQQLNDIKPYADVNSDVLPMRNVVFTCEEFPLAGFYDPRYLLDLDEVTLLDARKNTEPARFNAILANRMLAGFIEPGVRTDLLFRFGRVGNRLILINAPKSNSGFATQELRSLDPLAVATARDFLRLDQTRLEQYRSAGVASPLIDSLQSAAAAQLESAQNAQQSNQSAAAMMNAATSAWSNNTRVYAAAQDMANDVVRGAIFLLLLCVPFAFVMERLLVAATNVYHRIAVAAGIFVVMTAALWCFHPAFAISASPLIIVLAFAILFMSSLVMFVIYNRFDAELKKIRTHGTPSEAVSFARTSVLTSAILLGIANMRRRRFRTALTSITIVLITFALLCFTGATRYLDTTTLPTGVASAYPGIMIRQRGLRPLPELLIENFKPLAKGSTLVECWWNTNPADPRQMINVRAGDNVFAATAAVGLSPGESNLSQIAKVIGEKQFARLESGERDIVYLSTETATQLHVRESDAVTIGGLRITVAGIFEAKEFDAKVRTLSGEPISPLKYETALLDASGRSLSDAAAESLDLDAKSAGGELGATYERLSSNQFIIVPSSLSKLLPNPTLRSLAVNYRSTKQLDQITSDIARRFSVALFAGYDDGVRMVSVTNLARVNGAGQLAVPLAIAGLIIFNTMLGSIAERRREIHVYTSLGLAPLHVGALFVAEACVYGLIGTVFGYIIGQGVGTALLKLGWLGHITLNYSGTAAILTMSLILIIVIAAALIPARIASQIAAPSLERTWKVPVPVGDTITAQLPFTINKSAADNAIAQLTEFLNAHREGSLGKFCADDVTTINDATSPRTIRATIWLTPFDLGIRQQCDLTIAPGDFPDIYQVHLTLKRLSGDTNNWQRTNRTFLAELRKQFLQSKQLKESRATQR